MCTNFQAKQLTLNFWAQICPKVWIRNQNLQYTMCANFQNGHFLIFRSKFGEIAQLRAIFWFKYCWGCCRELGRDWNELGGAGWSWVEVKMSWMEMDWAGWMWVEVDGAGWSWVHGLVIPFTVLFWTDSISRIRCFCKLKITCLILSFFIIKTSM